jgi:hypothetical protein
MMTDDLCSGKAAAKTASRQSFPTQRLVAKKRADVAIGAFCFFKKFQ